MSSNKRKWYVVWAGYETGVCDTWEECQLRTKGFKGARYKAFDNQEDAIMAYRGDDSDAKQVLRAIASAPVQHRSYTDIPEILPGSIAVDAACSGNPGVMEYRGVDIDTGEQLFRQGPFEDGTNNIGEFLAIVHAMAMCYNQGRACAIYSDSVSGMAWVRKRHANTQLAPTARNAGLLAIVARAEQWLHTHQSACRVYKWQTQLWGEIPADFGRKGGSTTPRI